MSKFLQFELLDTEEIRKKKQSAFDAQIPLLPVDPMQNKFSAENVVLTDKEYEVLPLVLKGLSISEIALKIFLSISGVKFRLSNIYAKFGVKNRLALIKKSTEESLQFFIGDSPIKQSFHNRLDFKLFEKGTSDEHKPS
jgi:DNA-binding NarL/FixJ family response regulator